MLIVVNYHYVRPAFDAPYPGIHGITPGQLEAQLRLLGTVGEFVCGEQVRDAVRGAGGLPRRAILVTFDDGLREQFEHALPVLQQLGIRAVFFVNTAPIAHGTVSSVHKINLLRARTSPERVRDLLEQSVRACGAHVPFDVPDEAATRLYPYDTPGDAGLKYVLNLELEPEVRDAAIAECFRSVFGDVERAISTGLYMDVAQLRTLTEWACVGTHGHEHVSLGRMSRAAVRQKICDSLGLLTEWLGYRPNSLSYPYGSYEACTAEAGWGASDAGIEVAFTVERAGNMDLANPLYLARFDCNDLPGGRHARIAVAELFQRVAPSQWHRSVGGVCEQSITRDTSHQ